MGGWWTPSESSHAFDGRRVKGVEWAESEETTLGVFVHGLPEDHSWSAQMTKLREDNDSEFERRSKDVGTDEDKMQIRVVVRKRWVIYQMSIKAIAIDTFHLEQNIFPSK